jgi:hypothetical protein
MIIEWMRGVDQGDVVVISGRPHENFQSFLMTEADLSVEIGLPLPLWKS